uniref:ABI family, member 3a n=1 Tax=Monopterus albus TaxID=43700 RepID=UPI0009B4B66E|nr:abl interactor 1-like [Monopterus albus]
MTRTEGILHGQQTLQRFAMKDQNFKDEVMKILEEAPDARKALLENYNNLLNVADYCHNNYLQSGDGSMKALEETKNFTTQSLASVAYQISALANSVLSLLDAQTNQLRHIESSINLIGQTVEMHKEKVSRREVGTFTAVRRVPRTHKVLPPQPPAGTQPHPPYSRRPINYQQLDSLGHGMKVQQTSRASPVPGGAFCWRTYPPICIWRSSSSFGKLVAPPTIPTTWQVPPGGGIITTLMDNTPPPPPLAENEMPPQEDEVINSSGPPPPPPLPDLSREILAPPPPPPPSEALTNHSSLSSAPPLAPPIGLETVTLLSRRSRRHRSPPTTRSLSLRVRSDPASRCRYTRSLFLPAVRSPLHPRSSSSPRFCLPARLEHLDLEIPAPPPPVLLDNELGFVDIMPPLPPPVDYDTSPPPHYLEKVVALYPYEATKPDDLPLAEGDVIYLIHRHGGGWCEGVLNGNQGFFPENYVQSCD